MNHSLAAVALVLLHISAIAQSDTAVVENTADSVVEEVVKAVEAAVETAESEKSKKVLSSRSLGVVKNRDSIYINDDDTLQLYGEGYDGLHLLDSIVGDYSVFITGENHTYTESNARLWFKMIKYLNEKAGVRNVMFEYGQSYGFLVNEYLETGDTVLFNSIDRFAYPEYSAVIKELKVYNDSLPMDRKLHFTAIDIDRGVYPIVKALDYLLMNDSIEPSDSIDLHIQSIRSIASYNDYKLDEEDGYTYRGFTVKTASTLDILAANFETNKQDYKDYLGENYEAFRTIIEDQYRARKKWLKYQKEGAAQEYVYRENYMHQVFLRERSLQPGNWFGQFGRCHTTKSYKENNSCEWFEFNSLARRIKNTKGGELQKEVLTLAQVYATDQNFGPMHTEDKDAFAPYFEDMPKNSVLIFDLSQDSALYAGYGDDFDYLIFNTNNQRGETYDYLNTGLETSDDDETTVLFKIGVGQQDLDITEFRDEFTSQGHASAFNTPLQFYEFVLSSSKKGIVTSTTVGIVVPQNAIAGTTEWELDGYSIKSNVGYDLFKKSEWLEVVPAIGLGYQQLNALAIERRDTTSGVAQGFLGEEKHTLHTNPAFIFDFNGSIAFNVWKLNLGIKGGYVLDVSKKSWRTGDFLLANGPRTSLSGFYQSLFLGVRF